MGHTLPYQTGKCATFCGGIPLSACLSKTGEQNELRACKRLGEEQSLKAQTSSVLASLVHCIKKNGPSQANSQRRTHPGGIWKTGKKRQAGNDRNICSRSAFLEKPYPLSADRTL